MKTKFFSHTPYTQLFFTFRTMVSFIVIVSVASLVRGYVPYLGEAIILALVLEMYAGLWMEEDDLKESFKRNESFFPIVSFLLMLAISLILIGLFIFLH